MGEVLIGDNLTTNFSFVRLCSGSPAFGDAAGAFRASNVSGASKGFLPFLDIKRVFGFRWGIKLGFGTSQKIGIRIRDDIRTIDVFNCIAYGFDRVE